MKFLERNLFSKPKLILFLVLLFFAVSFFSFIINIEMYLNDKELLEKNFKNREFWFYAYFFATIGLGIFFFFLAKGLLNYKKWTWYFLVGSFFISIISVLYRLVIILLTLLNPEVTDEILSPLIINMIYAVIYIYLLKYFLDEKIQNLF